MRKLSSPFNEIMQLRPKYPIWDYIGQPLFLVCLGLRVFQDAGLLVEKNRKVWAKGGEFISYIIFYKVITM